MIEEITGLTICCKRKSSIVSRRSPTSFLLLRAIYLTAHSSFFSFSFENERENREKAFLFPFHFLIFSFSFSLKKMKENANI